MASNITINDIQTTTDRSMICQCDVERETVVGNLVNAEEITQTFDAWEEKRSPRWTLAERALRSFHKRYNTTSVYSRTWFHYCRSFVVKILSRAIAVILVRLNIRTINDFQLVRLIGETRLNDLWASVNEYQRCEAVYTGSGRSNDGSPLVCQEQKRYHLNLHETSQPAYGLSKLKDVFKCTSKASWKGYFIPDEQDELTENDLVGFIGMTLEYTQRFRDNKEQLYATFVDLCRICYFNPLDYVNATETNQIPSFSEYFHSDGCECCFDTKPLNRHQQCEECVKSISLYRKVDQLPQPNPVAFDPHCIVCMIERRGYLLRPCGHQGFCKQCADKMVHIFHQCPVCKQSASDILKLLAV